MLHLLFSLVLVLGIVVVSYTSWVHFTAQARSRLLLFLGVLVYGGIIFSELRQSSLLLFRSCPSKPTMRFPMIPYLVSIQHRNIEFLDDMSQGNNSKWVIFESLALEGSSYTLQMLAYELCGHGTFSLYINPNDMVSSQHQLLTMFSVKHWQALKRQLCRGSSLIIIDGIEFLVETESMFEVFQRVFREVIVPCRTSLILNTQHIGLLKVIKAWQHGKSTGKFPFEIRRWRGPTQLDVYEMMETTKKFRQGQYNPASANPKYKYGEQQMRMGWAYQQRRTTNQEHSKPKTKVEGNDDENMEGGKWRNFRGEQTRIPPIYNFGDIQRYIDSISSQQNRNMDEEIDKANHDEHVDRVGNNAGQQEEKTNGKPQYRDGEL